MDNKHKPTFKRASFIKVLEDDFSKKLPIPPAFTKIFEDHIPPWLILEIAGTRKCWRVDVEEDGNGELYLSCGFDCFVKAHSLEVGNFLLFELEEPSILQVKIFEKDGSEKTLGKLFESEYEVGAFESPRQAPVMHQEGEASPWPTMPSVQYGAYEKQQAVGGIKRKKGENEEPAAKCTTNNYAPVTVSNFERVAFESKSSSFSVTWTQKSRNSYLHIPKAIANKQKLENKDIVVLCDPEERKWLMEVRTRQSDGRVALGRGWNDFAKAYGIGAGDTLIFEFVTDRMMKVNIIKACDLDHAATGAMVKQEVSKLH